MPLQWRLIMESSGKRVRKKQTYSSIARIYELWTLTVVRQFSHESYLEPIVRYNNKAIHQQKTNDICSMSYARNDERLFVCMRSGTVLCWQHAQAPQSSGAVRKPTYIYANANL